VTKSKFLRCNQPVNGKSKSTLSLFLSHFVGSRLNDANYVLPIASSSDVIRKLPIFNLRMTQFFARKCPQLLLSVRLRSDMHTRNAQVLSAAIYAKPVELETMKISKFLWSVLLLFTTVALIAPQPVEAIVIDGRVAGQVVLGGSGTINESGGISSNGINGSGSGIHELDFNGQLFPHGPLSVTGATDDFAPVLGSQATFNLAIKWTGSGSSVTLIDVVPGMEGPAWNAPIVGANGFATGTFFTLKSATFDEDSLTLIGMGMTQLTSGDPLVQKHSPARIVIQGSGHDFTYDNLTVVTTALPEGGSGLSLLAIGLVAVEGLRRTYKKYIPDLICPAPSTR
jgi:hypothetical protein